MRITRTEHIDFIDEEYVLFVTIRIFIEMDLKNEKGSVPPARTGRGTLPPTFYCVNVN